MGIHTIYLSSTKIYNTQDSYWIFNHPILTKKIFFLILRGRTLPYLIRNRQYIKLLSISLLFIHLYIPLPYHLFLYRRFYFGVVLEIFGLGKVGDAAEEEVLKGTEEGETTIPL